jgi:AcrR family transcriptional regulator
MTGRASTERRRRPTQDRSKARKEAILSAAEELICECGAAQLTTRNIAERAGVPIGSFYQYFADREAIVRSLVDRYHQQIRENLVKCFSGINSNQDFEKAVKKATKMFAVFFEEHKAFQELWFGAQQWQPLREIDIQDTLLNADILYEALAPLTKKKSQERVRAACITYCDVTGSLTRLALRLDEKEKKRILSTLNDVLITHIRTVFD